MKRKYTSPQLTAVEFRVEEGFAKSEVCVTCPSNEFGSGHVTDLVQIADELQLFGGNSTGQNTESGGLLMGEYTQVNVNENGWFGTFN